jgi:predicted RNA-binding protein with TRAM domain
MTGQREEGYRTVTSGRTWAVTLREVGDGSDGRAGTHTGSF